MADSFPVPQLTPIDAYADRLRKNKVKKVGFQCECDMLNRCTGKTKRTKLPRKRLRYSGTGGCEDVGGGIDACDVEFG